MKENETALNEQTGKHFADFSEELVQREKVDIFTVVTIQDKGSFVAFGNAMLTQMMDRDTCIGMIHNKDWELIGSWTMLLNSVNKSLEERFQIETNEKESDEEPF